VTVCNREVRSLKGRSGLESEFAKFDHSLFTIDYPIDWMNVTRKATRFRPLPIVAYSHRNKRQGLLGAIADSVSWRLDAEFAIFALPLKEVRARIRSKPGSSPDEMLFDYVLSRFKLSGTKVRVVGKQKEDLGGRKLYHLTVNARGHEYEFRLVAIFQETAIVLRHSAPLKTLADFKQTFEQIDRSFRINRKAVGTT
jgi:hypothetical protein